MTKVEFLNAVVKANINADVTAYAKDALKKNSDRNDKRRTTMTTKQKANASLLDTIVSKMGATTVVTASEISKTYEISTQRASAILQNGVKTGVFTVADVKGKSGKVKGYSLANPPQETAEVSDPETAEDSEIETAEDSEVETPDEIPQEISEEVTE